MIAVPVVSLLLFAVYDLIKQNAERAAFIEGPFELAGLMIAFTAWACMLGMHVSLRSKKTVKAVMVSLGTLILILLAASPLWWEIVSAFGIAGAAFAPATPYTAIKAICDPAVLLDDPARFSREVHMLRGLTFVGSAAAVGVVLLIVASMYKSMVRNFDMTLRKQTAT
jgi:hypothetical protein